MGRKNVANMGIRLHALEQENQALKKQLSERNQEILRLKRVEKDYNQLLKAYMELKPVQESVESGMNSDVDFVW